MSIAANPTVSPSVNGRTLNMIHIARDRTAALTIALAVIGAAQLSGCAIVSSRTGNDAQARVGIPYMLPKALLPVELVEAEGVVMLRLLQPKLVGDPKASYVLHNDASAFSSDDVKIEVDVATGLLKSVKAHSTDEPGAILKQLAVSTAVGRAEKAAGDGESAETVLFSGYFDPSGDNKALLKDLTERLSRRVKQLPAACMDLKKDTPQCKADGTSKLPVAAFELPLEVNISAQYLGATEVEATDARSTPAVDCGTGICHRGLLPYKIDLEVKGLFKRSDVVQLPNGAPTLVLPLTRAAFVTTKHDVVLKEGRVESHTVDRPSSALQLVKWPLDVYEAVLAATSKLITLRIGANSDEVKRAQSELDTAKALKKIQEELEKLNQPKTENFAAGNVRFSGPSERGALITLTFGERSTVAKSSVTTPTNGDGIVAPDTTGQSTSAGKPNPGGPK